MNGLHKLRKEFSVSGIVDFEILLYMALISNVSSGKVEGDDTVYALCSCKRDDLYDIFATWDESTPVKYAGLGSFRSMRRVPLRMPLSKNSGRLSSRSKNLGRRCEEAAEGSSPNR